MLILTVAGLEDSALNLLPEIDKIISSTMKPKLGRIVSLASSTVSNGALSKSNFLGI